MPNVSYPISSRVETRSDNGGEWCAAIAECAILVVQVTGNASEVTTRLDDLWRSLTAPSGVQATLDELTKRGLSATEPFGLIYWESEASTSTVKAIVRGDIELTVHDQAGSSTVDGRGVSTWRENQFASVQKIDVCAGGKASNDPSATGIDAVVRVPFVCGVVVSRELTVDFAPALGDTSAAPHHTAAVPIHTVAAPIDVEATLTVDAVSTPESRSTEPPAVPEAVVPETVLSDAVVPEASASEGEESSYDYLFGETVYRTVQDAAVRTDVPDGSNAEGLNTAGFSAGLMGPDETSAAMASPSSLDDGDHDGHTIVSSDIAKLRAGGRGRKVEKPVFASPTAGPRLYIQLSNGSREFLTQPILVGRAPSANKVSAGQIPRLVTVNGSDQDISRNHAQFAVEGGTVVVTDLHSRNGTTVLLPGRPPQQLRQGEPTSVIVGTVVDLGGGVTFTVGEET